MRYPLRYHTKKMAAPSGGRLVFGYPVADKIADFRAN